MRRFTTLTAAAGTFVGAVALSFSFAGCGNSTSGTSANEDGATDATGDGTGGDVSEDTNEAAASEAGDATGQGDGDATAQGDADASSQGDGDAMAQEDAEASLQGDGDATLQGDGDAATQPDADDASSQGDGDAGTVTNGDAGGDAPSDALAEAGLDAMAVDNALAVQHFADTYSQAWCQRLIACCGLDGGTAFDMTACINSYESNNGWEGTLPPSSSIQSGHVVVDPDAGAACIGALGNFACPSSTSAQWADVSNKCFVALHGDIPVGQGPCGSSFECVSGSYCGTVAVDGGEAGTAGQCISLAGAGQPCDQVPGDYACSYLGSSSTGYFCNRLFVDSGATCQPLLDAGSYCTPTSGPLAFGPYDDNACKAQLCGDDYKCGSNSTYPFPSQCPLFVITDAGGGG